MTHLPFIAAAYGITIAGTILLCWLSWRAMRHAEARAERLEERQ